MPMRWRITKGGSWTWQYVDTDARPPKVVAKSNLSWDSKDQVRQAIKEMQRNNDIEEDAD